MKKLLIPLGVALLMAGCEDEVKEDNPTAQQIAAEEDERWAEWESNPEPYGGLEVLAKIREAKESGTTLLDLNGTQITDLSPLAGLTNLEKLSLYGNRIIDLRPLGRLKKLAHLRLFRNEISDITPLEGLTNLIVLSLNNNKISDVTPLTELTSLMLLGLDENPIPTDQKAMLRKALPECEIIF